MKQNFFIYFVILVDLAFTVSDNEGKGVIHALALSVHVNYFLLLNCQFICSSLDIVVVHSLKQFCLFKQQYSL